MDRICKIAFIKRALVTSKLSSGSKSKIKRVRHLKLSCSIRKKRLAFLKMYYKCIEKFKRLSLDSDTSSIELEPSKPIYKFDVKHWISVQYIPQGSSTCSNYSSGTSDTNSLMQCSESRISVGSTYFSDYDYGMHVCTQGEKRQLETKMSDKDSPANEMESPRKKRKYQ